MEAQHYRVVLADDDSDVRLLARRYLERSGRFTVVADAVDGEQAVQAAKRHQPDLTLLDLVMPDTDGLTALPRIRSAAPCSTVVVLSGLQRPHVEQEALAAGAIGFLPKRPAWSKLVSDLLGLLEEPRPPDPSGTHGRDRYVRLPAALTSGRHAREFLRNTLTGWGVGWLLDDAELLTTELINNAVLHATSPVALRLVLDDRRLRVEVSDTGGGALHRQAAEAMDTSGRGLFLVDALSETWGTLSGANGKSVWFELGLESEMAGNAEA